MWILPGQSTEITKVAKGEATGLDVVRVDREPRNARGDIIRSIEGGLGSN